MKRIAVIGSGISGLASAYLLSQHAHVTLYEKNARIGGHSRTIEVDYHGVTIPVDTGFIVFNHTTYPNLVALFTKLKVATEKSDMSFSFATDRGHFEWGAKSLNTLFAVRRNLFSPSFYRMIHDIAHFFNKSESVVAAQPDLTLEGLIKHMNLSRTFCDRFLLPMGAAIWSSSPIQMLAFPAESFVRFFRNHGLLSFSGQHQWYTVTGGSQEYIKKLVKSIQHIRLACSVVSIDTSGKLPRVVTNNGDEQSYDEIVIAAHADEALAIIDTATAQEQAVLTAFSYQVNTAYLHCDTSIMPKRKSCWASWNYHGDGKENVAITYWMNSLQNIDMRYPLFVTLNPLEPIKPDNVFNIHSFTHPVFTTESIAAQQEIPKIQGKRKLWFCGAYQRNGFHEDGLWSAMRVVQMMGLSIPWP